jgi:uncharacterized protein YjbI with pentapeptide repeats
MDVGRIQLNTNYAFYALSVTGVDMQKNAYALTLLLLLFPLTGCLGSETGNDETIDRCDILSLATEDIDGDGSFDLIGTYQERLNFTNCNLAGLDFSGLTFHYVDFSDSNLSSVQFSDSSLSQVLFNNVVLDEANFDSASLEYGVQVVNSSMNEASFKLTYMSSFWVKQSNITNVDLSTSIIESAAFIDIDVCPLLLPSEWHCLNKNLIGPNAWLMEADLSNLNLDGINLTGSSMHGTNLSNTHLSNSIMTEVMAQEIMHCPLSLPSEWLCINNVLIGPTARLNYADLGDLDLSSQNLSGMIISHSNLTGTDFSNSDMSGVRLWRTLMKNSNFSNTNLAHFEGRNLFDCPENMTIEWVCKPYGVIMRPILYGMYYDSRSGLTQVEFTETYYATNMTGMLGPQALITGFSNYFHSDLSNVNLSGAIIEDSDFNGVDLSSADLNGTVWMNTICPNGENSDLHGQSCEGQLEFSDSGTEIDTQFTVLSASMYSASEHICGISDGSVSCWNTMGLLDYNLELNSGRYAVDISTNGEHNCIILDDGSVSCWGDNSNGQLGDGTTTNRDSPTTVTSLGDGRTAIDIAAGNYHTCVILDNGSVSCWGDNSAGQLGDGTYQNQTTPTLVADLGGNAIEIAAGRLHTCVILDDGSVSCWGSNFAGQLGDGTGAERNVPTQTDSLGENVTAVNIATGVYHTCVVLNDGTVSCWGDNEYNALGWSNWSTAGEELSPRLTESLGPGRTAVMLNAGQDFTCAILDDGSVSCWGRSRGNLLGDGNNSQQDFPTLTTVIQQRAIYITAGEIGICVILEDNTFTCWGP